MFEKTQQRLDICSQCLFYKENKCNKCGCYMPIKAALPFSKCPLNKWMAVKTENERVR